MRIGVAPRYVCGAMDLVRGALTRIANEAFASDRNFHPRDRSHVSRKRIGPVVKDV